MGRLLLSAVLWITPFLTTCLGDERPFFQNSTYNDGGLGQWVTQKFNSSDLVAPRLNVLHPFSGCDDGSYIFIAPRGEVADPQLMILDKDGSLVWSTKEMWGKQMYNFQMQMYKGQQYLTFWAGNDAVGGHGEGFYYMLDKHYELYRTVGAANGLHADLHSFAITPQNTALSTIYDPIEADLRGINHRMSTGWIWDSMFQEIDLDTGEAIFEWRSSQHVDLKQSYTRLTSAARTSPWDFFHINCVEKDALGNYLVSSRHLRAVLYIDGRNGDVLWQLGGKQNSFTDLSDGNAVRFVGQHDAHWYDDADGNHLAVTLFDNGGDWYEHPELESKGMRIKLDLENMTATLDVAFKHEPGILSTSQGSYQTLPNGHVVIGFGFNGAITEYSPDGQVLCDAYFQPQYRFGSGDVQSYRNLRFNWTGIPKVGPSFVIRDRELFISWSGSTLVREYRIEHGYAPAETFSAEAAELYSAVLTVKKTGFETKVSMSNGWKSKQFLRVVGLDENGLFLGASHAIDIGDVATIFLDDGKEVYEDEEDDDFADEENDIMDALASSQILFGLGVLIVLSAMVMAWVAPSSETFRMCTVVHDDGGEDGDGDYERSTDTFWQRVPSVVSGVRRKHSAADDARHRLLRDDAPETSEVVTLYHVPPEADDEDGAHVDRGP